MMKLFSTLGTRLRGYDDNDLGGCHSYEGRNPDQWENSTFLRNHQ